MENKKIIIIDDDMLICLTLERIFSSMGINTTSVGNGMEGLNQVKQNPFDAIFLDIHLPDANGLDLIPRIKGYLPCAKIIIITADTNDELRKRALSEGALMILEKSFSLSEIKKVVKNILSEFIEKREQPRQSCDMSLKFSFNESRISEHVLIPNVYDGVAVDISKNGIRMKVESFIKEREHIRFLNSTKKNSFSDYFPSSGEAEVIWTKELCPGYLTGLKYLE